MKYLATLQIEAADEDAARQAVVDQVGAADFDKSSIELEEVAE